MRTYGTRTDDPFGAKIWEVARATSAAPTFFLPIKIRGVTYGDGGTGWNNPTYEAINEAHDLWPDRPIGCLVSLGTGVENPAQLMADSRPASTGVIGSIFSRVAPTLDFKRAVAEYCVTCLTSCEKIHQEVSTNLDRNRLVGRYFRLNVPGIGSIGLQEWKKLEDIRTLAEDYMRTGEVRDIKQVIAKILINASLIRAMDFDHVVDWTARNQAPAVGLSSAQIRSWQQLVSNSSNIGQGLLETPPSQGTIEGTVVTVPQESLD